MKMPPLKRDTSSRAFDIAEGVDLTNYSPPQSHTQEYTLTQKVIAIQIPHPFMLKTKRGLMYGRALDYLIITEDDRYPMRRGVFEGLEKSKV